MDVHFCPQCSQILTISRHGDYFAFLGIPRRLNLDIEDLEQRFRALSRQFHPDYFYNASAPERRASLERSSYLNDAYRTLRNPAARVEYLLGLEGFSPRQADQESGAPKAPASMLEEVFALNEQLDEVRGLKAEGAPRDVWGPKLEEARAPIEARRALHEAELRELSDRWDALAAAAGGAEGPRRDEVLGSLRERVLERNYLANLLEGIERELASEGSAEPEALSPEPKER
jgi:molecular chaperone HscB